MAAEGKAPTLAESPDPVLKFEIHLFLHEYSLPPKEVPVENSADEKSAISTMVKVDPQKDNETPVADESTAVEEKGETPEVKEPSEKPEAEETNPAAEKITDDKPEIKIETAPADFRFPTTNQTRHCFTRYVEYHRCIAAKGEDAPECEKFAKYYRSLCPSEWLLICNRPPPAAQQPYRGATRSSSSGLRPPPSDPASARPHLSFEKNQNIVRAVGLIKTTLEKIQEIRRRIC